MERKTTMQTHAQIVQTQTVYRPGRTSRNHRVAPLRWADHESNYGPSGQEKNKGGPAHKYPPTNLFLRILIHCVSSKLYTDSYIVEKYIIFLKLFIRFVKFKVLRLQKCSCTPSAELSQMFLKR